MADKKTGSQKAPRKITLKKPAASNKTSINETASKKETIKKAVPKKAPVKKVVAKKSPVKKEIPQKTDTTSTSVTGSNNKDTLVTIQSIVEEMREENNSRDKHITALVQEIQQGFSSFSKHSSGQQSQHDQEMTKLYQSLQSAFSHVKDSSQENEDRSLAILDALSDSIMKDHEQTLIEVHEQEKLQDKKIQQLDKVYKHSTGRNRLIAIPGVIIAIIAIIYMFYVVTIMEEAMTSMSSNMHKIQISVGNMSNKMDVMSVDTGAMNTNMTQLNRNVGQMGKDLNIMTHNVAPAMQGFRNMMPWSP